MKDIALHTVVTQFDDSEEVVPVCASSGIHVRREIRGLTKAGHQNKDIQPMMTKKSKPLSKHSDRISGLDHCHRVVGGRRVDGREA